MKKFIIPILLLILSSQIVNAQKVFIETHQEKAIKKANRHATDSAGAAHYRFIKAMGWEKKQAYYAAKGPAFYDSAQYFGKLIVNQGKKTKAFRYKHSHQ